MSTSKSGLPADPGQTFMQATTGAHPQAACDLPVLPVWSVADETCTLASAPTPGTARPAEHGAPETVAYRLLQQIALGGMGEVWEAEQTSLGRVIAVKRLRRQSDGEESQGDAQEAQFRSESAIAGSLEHPHILPVYDLGRGDDGAPLLAMKRVHGRPWKELLEDEFARTPVESFLARHVPILVAVTQAVAFAHSRGIIHRDIKPAQVLVGAFGEVLLTDWGLAIQTDAPAPGPLARMGAPTPHTATNPAGTPSMMAPEQTEAHGVNLGPWTDVYLLGGTLYYLLTGSYPHASDSSQTAFEQARSGQQVLSPVARAPGRFVPPELEQLCLRALEPARQDRLASAAVFLKGLQDYLSGAARKEKSVEMTAQVTQRLDAEEPDYAVYAAAVATLDEARRLWPDNPQVAALRQQALHGSARLALQQDDLSLARVQGEAMEPGEQAQSLRHDVAKRQRQVDRRRTLLRAATVAVCALLLVIAVGSLLFSRRMQAANAEIARRAQDAERALQIAKTRGSGAFDLINFVLNDLKTAMDEELTPKRGVTFDARNVIAHAIAGKVASPVVAYFSAAKPDSWPRDMQLQQATQLFEVGKHFNDLARYDEAQKLLEPALDLRERLLGKQSMAVADVLVSLAKARQESGQFKQAEAMIRRAIAIAEAQRGANDPKTTHYLLALAGLYDATRTDVKQLKQAEALYRRAATAMEKRHAPELATVLTRQGNVLDYLDRPKDAEKALRHALAVWNATHAPDDPDVAYIQSALANALDNENRLLAPEKRNRQQLAEAEKLLRHAVALLTAKLGPDHPDVQDQLSSLGSVLGSAGHRAEAEAIQRKVIASYEITYGPDNFRTGRQWLSLGFMLRNEKRLREAEPVLRRAIKILEKSLGPDYLEVGWGYQFLGFVLADTHRPRAAETALKRSIQILSTRRGPDHPETMQSKKALAKVEATLARSVGH